MHITTARNLEIKITILIRRKLNPVGNVQERRFQGLTVQAIEISPSCFLRHAQKNSGLYTHQLLKPFLYFSPYANQNQSRYNIKCNHKIKSNNIGSQKVHHFLNNTQEFNTRNLTNTFLSRMMDLEFWKMLYSEINVVHSKIGFTSASLSNIKRKMVAPLGYYHIEHNNV